MGDAMRVPLANERQPASVPCQGTIMDCRSRKIDLRDINQRQKRAVMVAQPKKKRGRAVTGTVTWRDADLTKVMQKSWPKHHSCIVALSDGVTVTQGRSEKQ